MPLFPNINTLIEKTTLSGDEVIQVSATEKTKLVTIARLVLGNLSMSTFVDNEDVAAKVGQSGKITAQDSIVEAIRKLWTKTGKDEYEVYPYQRSDDIFQIICTSREYAGGSSSSLELFMFQWDWASYKLEFYCSSLSNPDSQNTRIEDMSNYLLTQNNKAVLSQPEKLSYTSQNTITLTPNLTTSNVSGNVSAVVLNNTWDEEVLPSHSSAFVTTNNLTKSMFSYTGDKNATLIFSDGFDINPLTPYQCITVQLVKTGSTTNLFVINKCGYSPAS